MGDTRTTSSSRITAEQSHEGTNDETRCAGRGPEERIAAELRLKLGLTVSPRAVRRSRLRPCSAYTGPSHSPPTSEIMMLRNALLFFTALLLGLTAGRAF